MLLSLSGLPDSSQVALIDNTGIRSIAQSFAGSTRGEQILSGLLAARRAISKYTSNLAYSPKAYKDAAAIISSWENQHGSELVGLTSKGVSRVADEVKLGLSQSVAKAFIIGSYGQAAKGVPAWAGKVVSRHAGSSSDYTLVDADIDSEARLLTFASIVKMDRDGSLGAILGEYDCRWSTEADGTQNFLCKNWPHSSSSGASGLGVLPVAVVYGAVAVAVAAISAFVILQLQDKKTEQYNAVLERLCKQDPAECNKVLAELAQKGPGTDIVTEASTGLVKYAGLALIAYVGVVYGIPAIKKATSKESEN